MCCQRMRPVLSSAAGLLCGMRVAASATVGERIRQAREHSGLTQAALAEAAGISDETISRIERGAYEPAVSTLVAIARALGAGLDHLVGLRDAAPLTRGDSPLAARLAARAAELDAKSLRALLGIAELLPAAPTARRAARPRSRKNTKR